MVVYLYHTIGTVPISYQWLQSWMVSSQPMAWCQLRFPTQEASPLWKARRSLRKALWKRSPVVRWFPQLVVPGKMGHKWAMDGPFGPWGFQEWAILSRKKTPSPSAWTSSPRLVPCWTGTRKERGRGRRGLQAQAQSLVISGFVPFVRKMSDSSLTCEFSRAASRNRGKSHDCPFTGAQVISSEARSCSVHGNKWRRSSHIEWWFYGISWDPMGLNWLWLIIPVINRSFMGFHGVSSWFMV